MAPAPPEPWCTHAPSRWGGVGSSSASTKAASHPHAAQSWPAPWREAEDEVAAHLALSGGRLLRRNVVVGRDEIDLLAIDPGPPAELVFVEVRSATSDGFGAPEERVDRGKVAHL